MSFSFDDAAVAVAHYDDAVANGLTPIGGDHSANAPTALAYAVQHTGWHRSRVRRLLAAHVARRGHVGVPAAAAPPDGFEVARSTSTFDQDGRLVRQSVATRQTPGDAFKAPAGHVIKGESALLDPSGRVLAKWVKTQQSDAPALQDALLQAFSAHAGRAVLSAPPVDADDDVLTVYPVPDLHLGAHAWGRETGADYDVKIATSIALQSVSDLVAQSRPSREAVLLFLGDYFHANDEKAVTPGSGHRLDVDGRWPKVYRAGAELAVMLVDMLAAKHERVHVRCLKGNHDIDSSVTLTVALALFYGASDRITIDESPSIAWYYRFGKVLMGATHGHTMKPDQMAMMLAVDRPEDWGASTHRHMFFGHIHHETLKRGVHGVRVESFESPAGRDAWNAEHGYRSGRSLSAITFHRDRGEIGRHRVNIA